MINIKNTLFYIKDHPFARIIICMILCILFYKQIPVEVVRGIFTGSSILRNVLLVFLPFYIFGTLISSFAKIPKGAFGFTVFLLGIIALSNFVNLMIAYFFGRYVLLEDPEALIEKVEIVRFLKIEPLFDSSFPKWITGTFSNYRALIGGLVIGILCSIFQLKKIEHFASRLNKITTAFILKVFIPCLPIFVSGFLLKILKEGQLTSFFSNHLSTALYILCFMGAYLALWLMIATGFNLTRAREFLKNIAAPTITAFSSCSSVAALPLTIEASYKNTKDPVLVNSAIPIQINAHMPGCLMFLSIMILITMQTFYFPIPGVYEFAVFSAFFTLNKFSGAAVPGNTLFISIYLMRDLLGFTEEMVGFITAMYMALDAFMVGANTAANNIFIVFIKNILDYSKKLSVNFDGLGRKLRLRRAKV